MKSSYYLVLCVYICIYKYICICIYIYIYIYRERERQNLKFHTRGKWRHFGGNFKIMHPMSYDQYIKKHLTNKNFSEYPYSYVLVLYNLQVPKFEHTGLKQVHNVHTWQHTYEPTYKYSVSYTGCTPHSRNRGNCLLQSNDKVALFR